MGYRQLQTGKESRKKLSITDSMAAAVALMRPHLSSSLVSSAALARIEKLSALLPPIYWGGFECHLDRGPNHVDFHQGYNNAGELKKFLAVFPENPALERPKVSQRLLEFNRQWERSGSSVNRQVEKVSLEFDLTRDRDGFCSPSVFLFLKPFVELQRTDDRFKALVDGFLFLLTGSKTTKKMWAAIEDLAMISGGATVENLGVMTARKAGPLRMVIVDLPLDRAVAMARHIAPEKSAASIEGLLSNISEWSDSFVFDADFLDDSISSRIGIECYPKRSDDSAVDWRSFLYRFSTLGWCSREQAEGLLQWQGVTTPADCNRLWPNALILASLLKKPYQFTSFSRYLNHVKIVFSPNRHPAMKAYFGFAHKWIDVKPPPSLRRKPKQHRGDS